MASYNRIILVGNMTRDPELAHTSSNTAICKFGLAVNHKWRDRNSGEQREEVCFVDCVSFGRSGEVISQYMQKGKPILVEGRLHMNQWEGQDGTKRTKHEVIVDNFQFLGAAGGTGRGGGPHAAEAPAGADAGNPHDVPF